MRTETEINWINYWFGLAKMLVTFNCFIAFELGNTFTVMKRGAVLFNQRADGLDRDTLYQQVIV